MKKVVSFEIRDLETHKVLSGGTRSMDAETPNITILQEHCETLDIDVMTARLVVKSEDIGYRLQVGERGLSMSMVKDKETN